MGKIYIEGNVMIRGPISPGDSTSRSFVLHVTNLVSLSAFFLSPQIWPSGKRQNITKTQPGRWQGSICGFC